ncbi:MAG: enoyl-CoA hydratase/isomerase family protein [Novosphingobium sp.]|nr:enoyl-CoA hydratase/isomerase family protein [Novosphingobium sp.]
MQYEHCLVEVSGRIMTVTLNRPEKRNALHADANHELGEIFDRFERDPALRLAILTGAGDTAFCAGADIRSGMKPGQPPVPETGFAGLIARFGRRKPMIAAVNGFAMGGGFEAAMACDIIVAADHATFGFTEPRVGLAALGGGIQRIIRELGPKRAMALLLTARKITAQQAAEMGIIAEVVPAADLMDAAHRWAEEILECSPASLAATFAVADSLEANGLEQSIVEMLDLPDVRGLLTGPDAREGPRAFAEKRKPNWADPR